MWLLGVVEGLIDHLRSKAVVLKVWSKIICMTFLGIPQSLPSSNDIYV